MNSKYVRTWRIQLVRLAVVWASFSLSAVGSVSATNPVDKAVSLSKSLEAANQLSEQILLLVAGGFLITAGVAIILSSTTAYIFFSRKVEAMIQ